VKKRQKNNKTLLIAIAVLLVVAIIGTLLVMSAMDNIGSNRVQVMDQDTGEVSITIVEPPEAKIPVFATGEVVLEIE